MGVSRGSREIYPFVLRKFIGKCAVYFVGVGPVPTREHNLFRRIDL